MIPNTFRDYAIRFAESKIQDELAPYNTKARLASNIKFSQRLLFALLTSEGFAFVYKFTQVKV